MSVALEVANNNGDLGLEVRLVLPTNLINGCFWNLNDTNLVDALGLVILAGPMEVSGSILIQSKLPDNLITFLDLLWRK